MLNKKKKPVTQYRSTAHSNLAKSMSTQIENDPPFDDTFFQHNLPQYYRAILREFRRVTHAFVSFNILYFAIFTAELFLFFFFRFCFRGPFPHLLFLFHPPILFPNQKAGTIDSAARPISRLVPESPFTPSRRASTPPLSGRRPLQTVGLFARF